jgi:hypothetical protein
MRDGLATLLSVLLLLALLGFALSLLGIQPLRLPL